MRIRYRPTAIAQLDAIFAYISRRNPPAAHRVMSRIKRSIDRLADFPYSARPSKAPGVREMAISRYPYLVFYAVDDAAQEVQILRVPILPSRPLGRKLAFSPTRLAPARRAMLGADLPPETSPMADDALPYDKMTEAALRNVAREALAIVVKRGLPGEHHFYISFRTDHPAVVMPERLRQRYPEEITIVLQHQFYGLEVTQESFSVSLSFDGKQERLTVPFAALCAFVDPSVQFGLKFESATALAAEARAKSAKPEAAAPARRLTPVPASAPADEPPKPDGNGAGQVVSLDRFRKK